MVNLPNTDLPLKQRRVPHPATMLLPRDWFHGGVIKGVGWVSCAPQFCNFVFLATKHTRRLLLCFPKCTMSCVSSSFVVQILFYHSAPSFAFLTPGLIKANAWQFDKCPMQICTLHGHLHLLSEHHETGVTNSVPNFRPSQKKPTDCQSGLYIIDLVLAKKGGAFTTVV